MPRKGATVRASLLVRLIVRKEPPYLLHLLVIPLWTDYVFYMKYILYLCILLTFDELAKFLYNMPTTVSSSSPDSSVDRCILYTCIFYLLLTSWRSFCTTCHACMHGERFCNG